MRISTRRARILRSKIKLAKVEVGTLQQRVFGLGLTDNTTEHWIQLERRLRTQERMDVAWDDSRIDHTYWEARKRRVFLLMRQAAKRLDLTVA